MAKYYEQHIPPTFFEVYDYSSVNLDNDDSLTVDLMKGFRYIIISIYGGSSGASFELYNVLTDLNDTEYLFPIGAKELFKNQEVLTLDATASTNKAYISFMPNIGILSLKNVVGSAFDGKIFIEGILEK